MNNITHPREVDTWKYLESVISRYGVDGTSSDESEVEAEEMVEPVFQVHSLPWRRNIDGLLKVVDDEIHLNRKTVRRRGALPRRRTRPRTMVVSTRKPVQGLPRELYDDEWFNGLEEGEQMVLDVSEERWEWLEVQRDE